MTRIGLLSDTHSYFDKQLIPLLQDCDEIWHAGDLGNKEVYKNLIDFNKQLRIVHGNIDDHEMRLSAPRDLIWEIEGKKIFMSHIGGYPGKYPGRIKSLLTEYNPGIFVCGHSHILRVIYDKEFNLLYLNPGAAGIEGFHMVRTALRFVIDVDQVKDLEVIELGNKKAQIF